MSLQYATSTALNCTSFNSLASSTTTGVAASAVATTNTGNNTVDALVTVAVTLGAITPSATTNIIVWVVASEDGTNFGGAGSGSVESYGSDSTETIGTYGNNLRFLGSIHCHTASILMRSNPLSIAAAFGGVMPRKWQIVIQNQTGIALASSGNSISYSEIYYT